jgi:hypothetical protein
MNTFRRAAGLSLAVLLAGCSDVLVNDPDLDGEALRRIAAANQEQEGEIRIDEPVVKSRFRSEIRVTGALRPGLPVQVIVHTEALYDTRDAEIAVYAPEAELARRGGWRASQMDTMRLPVHARSRRPMSRGAVEVQQFQLTFGAAGRYRISVGAFAHGELTGAGAGWIADAGGRDIWLEIDEGGGRVVPDEEAMAGEPEVFEREESDLLLEPYDPIEFSGSTGSGWITRYHHPRYWNPVAGRYIVVPNMSYTVRNPNGTVQRSGTTQGRTPVRVDCPHEGAAVTVDLHMSNEWTFADGISYRFFTVCGSHESLVLFVGQDGVLHEGITVAGQGGLALFGARRPRIGWKYTSKNTSYYRSGNLFQSERIFFRTTYDSHQWFGGWASFIAGHEYGHAFQNSFGGVPSADSGCDDHTFTSDETLPCAFREGFANYFAAATMPPHPVNGLAYYNYFRNHWALVEAMWAGRTDGSRIEGAVAGFLINLTGHVNGDPLIDPKLSGGYVHNVLRYCEHETYNPWLFQHTWQRRTGIDHVVYCMENSVALSGLNASNYFVSRDRRPRNQRSGVAAPSRDLIRTRWMRALYDQTWTPTTWTPPEPWDPGTCTDEPHHKDHNEPEPSLLCPL